MVRAARNLGYRRLAVVRAAPLRMEDLTAVVEGCVLGAWEQRSRQTGAAPVALEELHLAGFGAAREAELAAAQQLGEATNYTREWQNLPPNELTPEALAIVAGDIATRHGLELEVLGPDELQGSGYNLIAAVGAGSANQPRLIRVQHRGVPGAADRCLALVGKGITFDAGGLTLKSHETMQTQKKDMSGGAAVLAAMDVIAARRLPLNVMAVVAAAENLVGDAAMRPGDVLTSASGRTVEVVNTDCEGRLVLADALTFAIRRGATHLVDLATLTAAANIALGHAATLGVASDDELWAQVSHAAELAGERLWRMPLYADYRVLLRSRIADLKNGYYGEANAITAAMFVAHFAEGRPWAHLDIAASSWNSNPELVTIPRGPLGAGTRLVVHLTELLAGSHRLA
jgi:leucyl aminopeptidase